MEPVSTVSVSTGTDSQAGPLAGLRVLDFSTTPAGAQASQTLADFGAEVVHVEPPGGSRLRSMPGYPFIGRASGALSSIWPRTATATWPAPLLRARTS
jgi:crotonobetainyl-CoA:carnitine CoA-transferase CaiB-like acyl-CoA transferase